MTNRARHGRFKPTFKGIAWWVGLVMVGKGLNMKYLWSFQPIFILYIFQKLQYPYTVLFHYFSTMNGQIFVKFVACTSDFIVLFVLYGYCSNMNHFSCIIWFNWVESSALHAMFILGGGCILWNVTLVGQLPRTLNNSIHKCNSLWKSHTIVFW